MGYHKNVLIMIAMIASPLAFAQQQSISGLQVVQERFNEHCAVCHGFIHRCDIRLTAKHRGDRSGISSIPEDRVTTRRLQGRGAIG